MLVNGLAPILAPVLRGQLLRFGSWRLSFIALTLLGLALVVVGGLGLEETLPFDRRRAGGLRESLAVFRSLLAEASFVGWAVTSGLAIGAMFVRIAASPFVLEGAYGVSLQGFSLVFALNALGIAAAGLVSARLVRRLGQLRLLILGLAGGLARVLGLLLGRAHRGRPGGRGRGAIPCGRHCRARPSQCNCAGPVQSGKGGRKRVGAAGTGSIRHRRRGRPAGRRRRR
ncbi:MAG: MFS transporter [Candidatus Dormibacteraeota bacterium]|uniref:MFS transporter n=1 Tax=Candidatus Dormiibacter inghamiae TaxID=3127013 RepID=A0A934K9W5_9BACT|nr:MFS transporter [Candidatus Dormibacteraeota bacterium]MBJ7606916.1 MFS transporter [Candidatus Dormibacteraeota bacterium]